MPSEEYVSFHLKESDLKNADEIIIIKNWRAISGLQYAMQALILDLQCSDHETSKL